MTNQKSSLQLNLFVPQPDSLTKEQLFSEDKREEIQGMLSDEKYNFYKEHTRFVSYEELLLKLAQMKDWLNENIIDWKDTVFYSPGGKGKSNYWITEHFNNNLQHNLPNICELEDVGNNVNTIIIADDAAYSGKQLMNSISKVLEEVKNRELTIVVLVPYMSHRAFRKITNYDKIKIIDKNIKLVIPNDIERINMEYIDGGIRKLIDSNYKGEPHYDSRTLLLFAHRSADGVSIPVSLYGIIKSIKSPYRE